MRLRENPPPNDDLSDAADGRAERNTTLDSTAPEGAAGPVPRWHRNCIGLPSFSQYHEAGSRSVGNGFAAGRSGSEPRVKYTTQYLRCGLKCPLPFLRQFADK